MHLCDSLTHIFVRFASLALTESTRVTKNKSNIQRTPQEKNVMCCCCSRQQQIPPYPQKTTLLYVVTWPFNMTLKLSTRDTASANDNENTNSRADSRLAPSQWQASLPSNAVSHWLDVIVESVLNRLYSIYAHAGLSLLSYKGLFRYGSEYMVYISHHKLIRSTVWHA